MQLVCAFDVSTRLTGVAFGPAEADVTPKTLVWDHGDEAARRRRLGRLLTNTSGLLKDLKPDLVVIEAPMQLHEGAKTSTATAWALIAGAIMVEAICDLRQVHDVRLIDVQDVRAHFVGQRTFRESYDPVNKRKIKPRENAKAATLNMCRLRGWHEIKDDNAADAAALWSYGCALVDPKLAWAATGLGRVKLGG